jgi:hypothetical protein
LGCGSRASDCLKERKVFFLKKEAKTFASLVRVVGQRARLISKSFLVLFFKKELLSSYFWS